jgi:hypothetical protein
VAGNSYLSPTAANFGKPASAQAGLGIVRFPNGKFADVSGMARLEHAVLTGLTCEYGAVKNFFQKITKKFYPPSNLSNLSNPSKVSIYKEEEM